MGPPTEQLIRDYLNRLSVIARTKLDQHDRQALVERTRALIELQAGPAATANPAHVRRVMSWIGDPAALVDLELQRVTAERPGSQAGQRAAATTEAPAAEAADVPDIDPGGTDPPRSQVAVSVSDPAAATTSRVIRAARLAATGVTTLAASTVNLARGYPLEATALLLIGVGAPIFPPVWLLGAGVALPSKIWDFRDKWLGLALPVVLMIIGVSALIVTGGKHSTLLAYLSEAWVGAGRISRGTVLIGAAYLLWRLRRGPREPRIHPWNKTHRFG